MNQTSYYNTTNEANTAPLEQKAKTQEELIWAYMNRSKMRVRASFLSVMFDNYPITSIRRALHNLEKQGKIKRDGTKVEGMYGRNEYVYYLCE